MSVFRLTAGVIAFILIFLSTSGCSVLRQTPAATEKTACNTNDPKDLQRFPQKAEPYLGALHERSAIMPLQRSYKAWYYQVWNADYSPEMPETVQWPFRIYTAKDAYGENLRPLPQSWFDAMRENANWQQYNKVAARAIALRRISLRNFPTDKPLFHDPCKAGEGFPFDYLQNSTVFANEPLYISHYSRDGAWAYVLTSYATGWTPSDTVARISPVQRHYWQSRPLLAFLKDDEALYTAKHDYLFTAQTAMVLPLENEAAKGYFTADAAIEHGLRHSRIIHISVPEDDAAVMPMQFNARNMQRVVDGLFETKYGWGGYYGERDCSSTIRDIFAPFGLWLPRNSFKQSKVGRVVSLKGLSDVQKREKIIKEALPFETLLYLKGHIMLYLGTYDGEPVALHTIWGIKIHKNDGSEGRFIIGKTVISSLELGKELPGYRFEDSLLHRLESMNFVFGK